MPPDRQRHPSARRQRVTLFRTRLIPFVLATALFALGGCGLFFEEGPTDATLATMNGLQAITEAIATAVLPPDVSGTTLPYSAGATGSGTLDEGEFAAYGRALVRALGESERYAPVIIAFPDSNPPPACPVDGDVGLTGSATVDDGRDPDSGFGIISITFQGMQAAPNNCTGYGHSSTGTLTADAVDTITVGPSPTEGYDRWVVQRDESASGSLVVTKTGNGPTYNVSFDWRRLGSLQLDVEQATSYPVLLGQSQTVYLTVNGQSCTGRYTGRLISPYDWDCS
jgi:hypothetical protein